ncbi:MAG: esterase-like activity of phytase family protein [Flavimaricola sp.]|nr:esterase-like activity of phytase family protein [Flavimaricola sp.]
MSTKLLCMTSIVALAAGSAMAQDMNFNRIASFPVAANNDGSLDESSAEIIAATGDGMTIVYTDSPLGVIGMIDITDPTSPVAMGTMDMGGEPTAVSIIGNVAFVGVNTSESYTAPSGMVKAIDIPSMTEIGSCDLGGQPDSTAKAPDASFIAIAIENERDEDLGDGRVPQMPAGYVALIDIVDGTLDCDSMIMADVTGLAEIAPEDPEPEFVDINALGETVVTMKENNHIVVLNRDGSVASHFSAGSVDLEGIDATDERAALIFTESQPGRLREPDGIQWIDDMHVAMANEGDMDGGSRGWTIMSKAGELVYESGAAFEHAVVQVGHYPDRRSDAKGVEPEGMEFATFGGTPMVFLLAERASVMGVMDVTDPTAPVLAQILPSGVSPEGVIAIPGRNLLVTANEVDLGEDGAARAHVMIYEYQDAPAAYPHITSEGADELIGWAAMSGLVADPANPGTLYAVNDSFFGFQPTIFTIDATQTPARITDATLVTRGGYAAQKLDMEGIALDGEGGFWIASEGRTDRLIPHAIYHVGADGEIEAEIPFPAELLAVETRFGAEGITLVDDTLWIAIQREWADDAENTVKLVAYNTASGEWGAVSYPKVAPETGWVGLSEIVAHGDYVYLIERDNQIGANAVTKLITRVPLSEMVPAPLGGELPVVTREIVRDLMADLTSTGGYVLDKVEGLAIEADGTAWVMTDNDGVDDSSGETMFWTFGKL